MSLTQGWGVRITLCGKYDVILVTFMRILQNCTLFILFSMFNFL